MGGMVVKSSKSKLEKFLLLGISGCLIGFYLVNRDPINLILGVFGVIVEVASYLYSRKKKRVDIDG